MAPEYVQGLFSHMEEGISKIIATQEHYEVLNKKLDELQTEKKDQEAEQRLLKENSELNKLIVEQQNRVNQADKKIAELRNQLEKKEEEVKVLEKKIVELTGHTDGSIGVEVDESMLFVGDALMNMFYPTVSLIYGNEQKTKESAHFISEAGDKTIYFGHGKSKKNRKWVK